MKRSQHTARDIANAARELRLASSDLQRVLDRHDPMAERVIDLKVEIEALYVVAEQLADAADTRAQWDS